MTSRLERLCAEKGMKMTGQRRIIARVLSEADDHPDVEEVYRRAIRLDPRISIATVSGPTPPGTGVIHPATSRQESKSASPTIRDLPSASKTLFIPISISAAPGLIMSPVTSFFCPTATNTASACRE